MQPLLILGRGIGQVMFQNNAMSGLLMLIGIALGDWKLAILAVIATLISTLTAYVLKYPRADITNGLYGFNGALVGIAVGVFMQLNGLSLLLLVLGAIASTLIAKAFRHQNMLSGYTMPFILVVWGLLLLSHFAFPDLLYASNALPIVTEEPQLLEAFWLNIGQVFFQGNTLFAGMLILLAILINSPTYAFYAALGAVLSIALDLAFQSDYSALNAGLMGYNGVLCAMALGSRSHKSCVYAMLATLIAILLQMVGIRFGLTTLTAPFVFAVWIVSLQKRYQYV